ncbi:MAG: corrinoid protein [Anaerolineales bacterium]|nr:MAG: corrinoid protein [Anaerolineales bacterium]
MSQEVYTQLSMAVIEGDEELAVSLTKQALDEGLNPLEVVNQGLTPGMEVVGDKFSCGEFFLPHLVMAGKAMQSALILLEPALKAGGLSRETLGTVVLGTVAGDIHEIGKSLVGIMLTANGFVVHDLGVDVPVSKFVEKVRETGANLVGLSALLTTTMGVQRRVIEELIEAGLRNNVKVMVGGSPVSAQWAQEIGADGYAEDATGALALARRLVVAGPG